MKMSDYQAQIVGKVCPACKRPVPSRIQFRDHAGGFKVDGFSQRQWLWVSCPGCSFDIALWKLGIEHPYQPGGSAP
jgi:hypothetical protein